MDARSTLTKVITLIYRSRLMGSMDSDDLCRTTLSIVDDKAKDVNFTHHNPIRELKLLALEMLDEKEVTAPEYITQRLSIILENDQKLLKTITEGLSSSLEESANKRMVTTLIKNLNNLYKEHLATEIFHRVSADLKFNRTKITNFLDYLKDTLAELEPFATMTTLSKDPAIIGEVDFSNREEVLEIVDQVKRNNALNCGFVTGFKGLNAMVQEILRLGETVTVGALQHNYKTGFTLSLFAQIATLNSPVVRKHGEGKKPLLLRISFEDSLNSNFQFLYQYLKAQEGIKIDLKAIGDLDINEITDYIMGKLTATGFNVKFLRVNPSDWTYSSLFNKVIEYEAQGYDAQMAMVDYLPLIPTTGCTQGALGTDTRDLLRRSRNFFSARETLFITPLQLSSDAKTLVRNGLVGADFLDAVAEKGYYDRSKALDQEIDLELFLTLVKHNRKTFLGVRRGKHRLPTNIEDHEKMIFIPFVDKNTPLLEDYDKDYDNYYHKLPAKMASAQAEGIYNELGI